jgi:hypothetical protein
LAAQEPAPTAATLKTLRENFAAVEPSLEHEQDAARFLKALSGRAGQVTLVAEQPTDVHSVGALLDVSLALS